MNDDEMFKARCDFDPRQHEVEAQDRWGDTAAYRDSLQRTARYTPDDWKAIRAENQAILDDLGRRFVAGEGPGAPDVQALVERHRAHIDRWYYPNSMPRSLTISSRTSRECAMPRDFRT